MPLFDTLLQMFRRKKPEEIKSETPSKDRIRPMAQSIVNTITLSPDMSTLYLIDSGRAFPFPLQSKTGVVIGLLDGQLSVVTALPDISIPTEPGPPTPPTDDDGPIKRIASRPLRLSTITYRWTVIFFPDKGVLSIVGATDIDASIVGATDIDASIIGDPNIAVRSAEPAASTDQDIERSIPAGIVGATDIDASLRSRSVTTSSRPRCLLFSFSLKNNNIRMRKAGDVLEIYL